MGHGHEQRMTNPAIVLDVQKQIHTLAQAIQSGGAPEEILKLVHLRASQINGCGFCVDLDARGTAKELRKGDMPDEGLLKLFAVAAWRDTPYFTDAERAALALTEAVTRLSDRSDPVPDEIWDEAARHFDEKALSSVLMWIGITNFFNRLNVPIRQPVLQADKS
jgi:alkylhydroperoxidase family enzyme